MKKMNDFLIPILVLSLVVTLSSCTDKNAADLGSETSAEANVSDSAAASENPSDAGNLVTIADIKNELKQEFPGTAVEIVNTTEVGMDYLLVEYGLKTSTNRFSLYNLKMGIGDHLPVQDVTLLKVVSENYFIFEDRGEFTDTPLRFFPAIVRCFRVSNEEGDENFRTINEDEYFELGRSVEAGDLGKSECVLSAISVTFDGIEGIFRPFDSQESADAFYVPSTYIPPIATSYDADSNQFTMEIEVNHLGDNIVLDKEIQTDHNAYISSYIIKQEDNQITIQLTLRTNVQMYQIGITKVQYGDDLLDGFPYFYLNFVSEVQVDLLDLDY